MNLVDMRYARKYTRSMAALNIAVLEYIAKHLAVSLSGLAQEFSSSASTIKGTLEQLVSLRLVKEEPGSGDALYLITAEGVKEVEKTVKRGAAAFF